MPPGVSMLTHRCATGATGGGAAGDRSKGVQRAFAGHSPEATLMKRSFRALAVGITWLVLAASAQGAVITTSTSLSGPNENPANASPGTGGAFVTLDTTTHRMRVSVVFSGLTANTTASHIHCCTSAPNNAGVATVVPAFPGFPLGVTSGTYDQTLDTTLASTWNATFITNNGGTPAGAEAALANGLAAGQAYLNVHTSAFPAGEIRGFLVTQSLPLIGSIPTLSEWGLIGLVVLLAGATVVLLRRRHG
jgi:hypothetical protein